MQVTDKQVAITIDITLGIVCFIIATFSILAAAAFMIAWFISAKNYAFKVIPFITDLINEKLW